MATRTVLMLVAFLCGALSSSALPAMKIKLGSVVPRDSHWDRGLRQIAAEWHAASGGSLTLTIYPGGVAGDELDIIRKMRIGQIDAAALSAMGLNTVYSGVASVVLPSLVRTDAELRYVLTQMRPFLEQELQKRGYKVILWTSVGWVYFFARYPVLVPEDLQRLKLFVMSGDSDKVSAWQAAGFNVVPLGTTDILPSLQSGLVDAMAVPPLIAAAYQWFAIASNMTEFRWAPLIGAVVIRMKTWQRIDSDLRHELLSVARRHEAQMWAQTEQVEQQALQIMQANGLTVHPIPQGVRQRWETLLVDGSDALIGKSFDEQAYSLAKGFLDEYRRREHR